MYSREFLKLLYYKQYQILPLLCRILNIIRYDSRINSEAFELLMDCGASTYTKISALCWVWHIYCNNKMMRLLGFRDELVKDFLARGGAQAVI